MFSTTRKLREVHENDFGDSVSTKSKLIVLQGFNAGTPFHPYELRTDQQPTDKTHLSLLDTK